MKLIIKGIVSKTDLNKSFHINLNRASISDSDFSFDSMENKNYLKVNNET